jgi:hypothetical protein
MITPGCCAARKVDREDLVEVGGGQLVGVLRYLDAGVVDQDVQPPVLAHHPVEHLADGLLVGYVGGDEDRPPAGLRHFLHADLHPVLDRFPGGDRAFGRAHVVDRDVGALLAQADGDRLPDARAAAGDESNLVLQSPHGVLLVGLAALLFRAVMPVPSRPALRRYGRTSHPGEMG